MCTSSSAPRRRRRSPLVLIAGAIAALVLGSSVALAATLVPSSSAVAAGSASVQSCDAGGFTYAFSTFRGNLTGVTVGDIADPACEGGTLHTTLRDAGGTVVATAGPLVVPTDGDSVANSMTLATSAQPAASTVSAIDVNVSGP